MRLAKKFALLAIAALLVLALAAPALAMRVPQIGVQHETKSETNPYVSICVGYPAGHAHEDHGDTDFLTKCLRVIK